MRLSFNCTALFKKNITRWTNNTESYTLLCVRFMSSQVSLQIALLGEFSLTVRTLERFHPVVAERVSLQAVQREETLRALRAHVRALPGVRARVHVQVTLGGEALPAVRAGVRQLARVRPNVQQQLPGGQKRLPASGAQEIALAPVHLHVSRDARFAEAFPADSAEVRGAFVQLLVLLERMSAQEALVALAADEYPPSLVESLVLIVSRGAGESLLTLAAVVREAVKLHVSLQLIRMFKKLSTLCAFGFLICEVFGHGSRDQKSFVFPSTSLLVFQVVLLLLPFSLFFTTFFLFAFPLFA